MQSLYPKSKQIKRKPEKWNKEKDLKIPYLQKKSLVLKITHRFSMSQITLHRRIYVSRDRQTDITFAVGNKLNSHNLKKNRAWGFLLLYLMIY